MLRGEVTVGKNSWHYKFYQWWQRHGGGNKPTYRENLCHYMRVVFIWVPIFWMLKARIYKGVRPWMVSIVLLWSAVFLALPYNGQVVQLSGTIIAGVITSVLLGAVLGLIKLINIADANDDRVIAFLDKVILPFEKVGLFFAHLWKMAFGPFFKWFLLKSYYFFKPWMVALASIYLAILVLSPPVGVGIVVVLIIAAILIGAIITSALLMMTAGKALRKKLRKRSSKKGAVLALEPKGTSTVKLAAHFVMAKKRKICPFINLPSEVYYKKA